MAERRHTAGPGAPQGQHVTIAWEQRNDRSQARLLISVGRALDAALGAPEAYAVWLIRGRLIISPATSGEGWRVNRSGVPRFYADGLRERLAELPAGSYEARVVSAQLIVEVAS